MLVECCQLLTLWVDTSLYRLFCAYICVHNTCSMQQDSRMLSCVQIRDPVCGQLASPFAIKTFMNMCYANCYDARVLFDGECGAFGTASTTPSPSPPPPGNNLDNQCICITVST